MKLHIMVARAKNGVIGHKGKMPWHLPEDLKRFKQITTGHAVIMGRKTYESIGKPLPNRRNIVLTRRRDASFPDAVAVAGSLDEALAQCRALGEEDVFIIGGGEVYRQALLLVDELHVTLVDRQVEGDVTFPDLDAAQWRQTSCQASQESPDVQYIDYVRVR